MSTQIFEPLVAIATTSIAGAGLLQVAAPAGAQEWTVLGLLSFVVAGVGTWLVKSIDKTTTAIESNTRAQAEVSKSLVLLMEKTDNARTDGENKRRQILEALDDLPDRVADKLRKPA